MPKQAPRGEPAAFIDRLPALATDECIEWPFGHNGTGYGHVHVNGKQHLAHRVVCERFYGPAPTGAVAAHAPLICHNRACVNPRHLRWASRKENGEDAIADDMTTRGERNTQSKLTREDIWAIRTALAAGETQRSIAARYKIHQVTVSDIKTGDRWGWLE